ncbi:MAG: thiamine pyrophosphate-binding protein [Chloroflexota bacterium]
MPVVAAGGRGGEPAMTGGDVVVRMLRGVGVETVFGLISIHNIPIFDAIARDGGIRLVTSRSEPGAVNMADAYARVTGKLGVAITSTGTGAGNAAGALTEAQISGSAVLHLTGQIDSAHLDQGKGYIHEARDQLTTLRGASKRAYRLTQAPALAGLLSEAIDQALAAPKGPVSLEMPIDLQKAEQAVVPELAFVPPSRLAPAPASIDAASAVLARAQRPLIWAGGGVIAADAASELTALAERLGALVITSGAGRGSIPEDHPLCLGNWALSKQLWPFIESCDATLIAGSHTRASETRAWTAPLPHPRVQIDADRQALGRSYSVEVAVAGDAKLALAALLEHLPRRQADERYLESAATGLRQAQADLRQLVAPYLPMMDAMRRLLPRDGLFVRDVTIPANTWGNRLFEIYQPRTSIHPGGGGIGQGLQMAIGAKLGAPERAVLCIAGDGGLLVNIGEMATAVQERAPVVLVLFNDAGYGVLRNIQDAHYAGRHIGVDLRQPDFQRVGEAFGWWTRKITRVAQFEPLFEQALELDQPALLEVDMTSIGHIPFRGLPMMS